MKPENLDIRVTGPNSYSQKAKAIKTKWNGQKIAVIYSIGAPDGLWDATADGQYLIELFTGQITDAHGNAIGAGAISSLFICNVSGTWTPPPHLG